MLPARMKNGIAISAEPLDELNVFCINSLMMSEQSQYRSIAVSVPAKNPETGSTRQAKIHVSPRATAIGMPISRKTTKKTVSHIPIPIYFASPFVNTLSNTSSIIRSDNALATGTIMKIQPNFSQSIEGDTPPSLRMS